MKKVQEIFFLAMGGLLGSVGILYGMTFHYFLLFVAIFFAFSNWNSFIEKVRSGKDYILVFIVYLLYISLQTIFLNAGVNDKAYFGIFETISLNFILVPVYVATLREIMTSRLLKQFLFLFCAGCVLLNLYIVFYLVGKKAFMDMQSTIEFLYTSRFGDNKMSLLGGSLLLEPQAFTIALTALISYIMIFIERRWEMKILCGMMLLLLLFFLSFTVTKAGLLAFTAGFVLVNIYILKKRTWRMRLTLLACVFLFVSGVFVFDGFREKYKERTGEIIVELGNIKHGVYSGGTIAPRVGFIREAYIHVDEFAFWGLGVYAKNRVKEWFKNSDAGLGEFRNVHNTFLHYWIQGGVFGLAIMIFLFGAPFYMMIRNRRFSYLIASMMVVIIITNGSTILLDLNNSRFIIVLLLSMFYYYGDTFRQIEKAIIR